MIPISIQEMYPRVPVELLVSAEWQQRFREQFLASGELDADPFQVREHTDRPHRKCVSVCLFKQSADNRVPHEFPLDEDVWRRKYWDGLLSLVGEMGSFPEWKLRVYLERDLGDQLSAVLACHPQVELFRMSVNSVGAGPGTLWRYLALADRTLDVVLATDVDEPLGAKADCIRSFEMDSWSSIGRLGGFVCGHKYLIDPNRGPARNYATLLGSRVMSRPARWDFDPAAAMRGFMAYRRSISATSRPWSFDGREVPSIYNRPVGGHVHGWGSHWYMYCFDERFLKHVVYYHFADRGGIHTWAPSLPMTQMDPEGICDLRYVRARGNTTVCPHAAVRLAPLQLAPEALRVAYYLAEQSWLFDALLRIMREHPETGHCGNVWFHNIADPHFLELVPKQVNLFEAARHASKALEIGFNAGHSTAILLLGNPRLSIRAFDTCQMAYTRPCLDFLNEVFGDRITLVAGPSQVTVPADGEEGYDLVHIDGDHTYAAVAADLANALPRCVNGAVVILDDYEAGNDVERAARSRADLVPADGYTLCRVNPGSSHAAFRYRANEAPPK
jgi:Methyltransferase domain